jgi:CBS domain-containing protein
MKAKDIMTGAPLTCSPGTNLAVAAELMLNGDCGILPVVDEGKLVGVVTDRDLFIALGTRDRRASDITVGDVVQAPAITCGPDEDALTILDTMRTHRVRRLPVEGFGATVLGIVSLNDVVRAPKAGKGLSDADIVEVLRALCAHHHPAPHVAAA